MEIDLLFIADCPNRQLARQHLDVALARTELAAVIREMEVSSAEEAARLGMGGSPTILINGRDPFIEGADATALSCRLYRGEAGFSGAPTVDELVVVLDAVLERYHPNRGGGDALSPMGDVMERARQRAGSRTSRAAGDRWPAAVQGDHRDHSRR